MSPSELQLYSPYAEGLRYLLAQSPDTRDLVPEENEGNWEPIGKKKDVKMYKEIAQPPEKMNKTRGIGIIAAPPELVAGVVADEYEAWDDTMKDLKTLTSERDPATGALVEICWSRYCLQVPLLKDRDFLYREVTQKLPNGVFIIYGQSLSQEEEQQVEGVPCIKGVIRGEMGASGWVIAPVNGGAASSITYVALTDLKGKFPPALVNQFTQDVPLTINDVRRVVMKKLASQQQ
ncbi:hypothetical protein WJX75_000296 [Coccomyxa subellipsoidea]|uniref:START domain-containing protein n=1 Tax=Coccomyxa subellipsoidea TaxID=248742 RepID=A0ABR2Z343_9CHLO